LWRVSPRRFGPIDDLPRLTDERRGRQPLSVECFQPAPAPHPLHEERLENERLSELRFGHVAKLAQAPRLWFCFWCAAF
jgi:hypothetical protein